MLQVEDVSFHYENRQILKNISFKVEKGELLCILGPNGVGKSTLFKIMLGLLKNFTGEIYINKQSIKKMSIENIASKAAYIPQSSIPVFNFTVFDMVLMGTTAGIKGFAMPSKRHRELAVTALKQLEIIHLKDRSYSKISGGERQLVLIARALAQETDILIMDEPTANLDYGNQIRVLTWIKRLTELGYTIIQSTHQPEQTFLFADRVIALKAGEISAYGNVKDVVNKELIASLYNVDVDIQSLYNDKVRVCIPIEAVKYKENL